MADKVIDLLANR